MKSDYLFLLTGLYLILTLYCENSFAGSVNTDLERIYIAEHLTVNDGLSHNEVTSIIQDNLGFLWLGTHGGLNRYDGYNFLKFKPDPENRENSIVSTSIEKLFEDSHENIWIGTKSGGISRYSLQKETFTNYTYAKNIAGSLSDQRVISFFEDNKKRIWIGTWSGGVNVYNYKTDSFTHYLHDQNVGSIIQTRDERIWAASYTGLWCFNEDEGLFNKVPLPANYSQIEWVKLIEDGNKPIIWIGGWESDILQYNYLTGNFKNFGNISGSNEVLKHTYSLFIDSKSHLWVGTWGQGLYQFDSKSGKFIKIALQPDDIGYSANLVILDIFEDKDGYLWVTTSGNGVFKINTDPFFFSYLDNYSDIASWMKGTDIVYIKRDQKERMWLGTSRKGLFFIDKKGLMKQVKNKNGNSVLKVSTIYRLQNDKYWVGYDGELSEVEWTGENAVLTPLSEIYKIPALRNFLKIISLHQENDTVWAGTQQSGLLKLLFKDNELIILNYYKSDLQKPNWLHDNRITRIFTDQYGKRWVATYNGLYIHENNGSFININKRIAGDGALTSDIIIDVARDNSGNIWLGTPNGINCIKKRKDGLYQHQYYNAESGLSGNYINAILVNELNQIWVSTNVGISRINQKSGHIYNFHACEGIRVNKFTERSAFIDGELFHFGGSGGIVSFNPVKLNEIQSTPDMVFTEMRLFNKKLKVGEEIKQRVLLDRSINHQEEILLSHDQNDISFEISVLDFDAPELNQYAYKMEGLEDLWVDLGNRNWITFNDLKPGNYKLHVKGANDKNVWNEEGRQVSIIVQPPWWMTWYAYIAYASIIFIIVLVIRYIAIRQERLSRNIDMLRLKNEQEKEINEMKLRFFTNISHEFKTPLTMIICPLKEMLSGNYNVKIPEGLYRKLNVIQKNAIQLQNLINQIIDLRKIDTGNVKLNMTDTHLKEFIEEIAISFRELAQINNKKFTINFNLKDLIIHTDKNKLETIINNLISNSFKYTSEGGRIDVQVRDDDHYFFIEVKDDGKGISEKNLSKVFDRYFQDDNNTENNSSGIGLALVRQMTGLLNGKIEVDSERGAGTNFRLIFKKYDKGLQHDVETAKPAFPNYLKPGLNDHLMSVYDKVKKQKVTFNNSILIVEDDNDLREYLEHLFEEKFTVISASDGEIGYQKALKARPDLIISDIMMPKIDGLELCDKIKSSTILEELPVILLTAKSTDHFKLIGASIGADDYISKPFDPDYLVTRVLNILNSREVLKEHYIKKIKLEPGNIEINDHQKEFIEEAIRIIEKNIDNPHLNARFLAEQLNLSQSTLYRKLKVITGMSITGFIRNIRIKRAAQLLKDGSRTIGEIAYEVGFSDLKYFRKNFEKLFNMSPGQYRSSIQ